MSCIPADCLELVLAVLQQVCIVGLVLTSGPQSCWGVPLSGPKGGAPLNKSVGRTTSRPKNKMFGVTPVLESWAPLVLGMTLPFDPPVEHCGAHFFGIFCLRGATMTNNENPSIIVNKYLEELIHINNFPLFMRNPGHVCPFFQVYPCFSRQVAHWNTNLLMSSLIFSHTKSFATVSAVLVIPQWAVVQAADITATL